MISNPKLPIYKSTEVFVYNKSRLIDPNYTNYIDTLDNLVNEIASQLNNTFESNAYIEYFHYKHGHGILSDIAAHCFEINGQIKVQINNEFYQYKEDNVEMTKWSVLFQFIYFNYDAYHTACPIVDCFICEAERNIHNIHDNIIQSRL